MLQGSGTRQFVLNVVDKAGTQKTAQFDLGAGTVFSSSGCTATITSVGGGWWRCSILFDSGSGASQPVAIFQRATAAGGLSYTGDSGATGTYLARPQLEIGVLSAYVAVPCVAVLGLIAIGSSGGYGGGIGTIAAGSAA